MAIRLFEIVLFILGLWVLYSQLWYPAFKNRPIFPWFRKENKILSERTDLNQTLHEKELQAENEELRKKIDLPL